MKRHLVTYVLGLLVGMVSPGAGQDPGPPGAPSAPQFTEVDDAVFLSFVPDMVKTSLATTAGDTVTVYVLALLADPRQEVVAFSCQIETDARRLRAWTWQAPAVPGRDDAVAATFEPPLSATSGLVVLATATAVVDDVGKGAVRMVNAPVLATRPGLSRDVPYSDSGRQLDLDLNLGSPGAPGTPVFD